MVTSPLSSFDPCVSGEFSLAKFVVLCLVVLFLPASKFVSSSGPSVLLEFMLSSISRSFLALFHGSKSSVLNLSSVFSTILLWNLLGLLAFSFCVTSHMSVNLSVGLVFWGVGVMFMARSMGFSMAYHFVPEGSPVVLSPFLVVVELISNIIRPLSLSVRLVSNMIAGHMILGLMWEGLWEMNPLISIAILFVSSGFLVFELAVSIIQAFVFSTLISLYWEESSH